MGLGEAEQIERLQAKYVKMTSRVNRNTPSYIWIMEAGVRGIAAELWNLSCGGGGNG